KGIIAKVNISGIPLGEDKYVYSHDDLIGRLGRFDEPSWAVGHRGSLIFECAYDNLHWSAAEKLRGRVAAKYDIPADLDELEFATSGALLLTFLRLSGLIPKLKSARRYYAERAGEMAELLEDKAK